MILIEHPNHDSKKPAELRQRTQASISGTAPRVSSRSTRDTEHPDTCQYHLPRRSLRGDQSPRSQRRLCLATVRTLHARPIQTDQSRLRSHRRTAATAGNSDGAQCQRGEVFGPCLSISAPLVFVAGGIDSCQSLFVSQPESSNLTARRRPFRRPRRRPSACRSAADRRGRSGCRACFRAGRQRARRRRGR